MIIKNHSFIVILLIFAVFSPVYTDAQDRNAADFSLRSLQTYEYRTSPITIQRLAQKNSLQYAYNVTFTSMGLTVSGRLSVPAIDQREIKGIILMLRGHQRPTGYYTGKGTENPARRYLEQGWAVIAPDFFGYADSSPTPPPAYLHQFYSTINAIELYKSLEQPVFLYNASVGQADRISLPSGFQRIVLWGHSNGGQVALHFLQVTGQSVPTVLWAPVGLPFPESAGHYGRGAAWLEEFKRNHTAADFSLLSFLDRIASGAQLLLHQGDRDNAVPKSWNDALVRAIGEENTRRISVNRGRINIRYEIYAGADHNLNPFWNTVIPRDVEFWETNARRSNNQ